jgi:hypothetical protein
MKQVLGIIPDKPGKFATGTKLFPRPCSEKMAPAGQHAR